MKIPCGSGSREERIEKFMGFHAEKVNVLKGKGLILELSLEQQHKQNGSYLPPEQGEIMSEQKKESWQDKLTRLSDLSNAKKGDWVFELSTGWALIEDIGVGYFPIKTEFDCYTRLGGVKTSATFSSLLTANPFDEDDLPPIPKREFVDGDWYAAIKDNREVVIQCCGYYGEFDAFLFLLTGIHYNENGFDWIGESLGKIVFK